MRMVSFQTVLLTTTAGPDPCVDPPPRLGWRCPAVGPDTPRMSLGPSSGDLPEIFAVPTSDAPSAPAEALRSGLLPGAFAAAVVATAAARRQPAARYHRCGPSFVRWPDRSPLRRL